LLLPGIIDTLSLTFSIHDDDALHALVAAYPRQSLFHLRRAIGRCCCHGRCKVISTLPVFVLPRRPLAVVFCMTWCQRNSQPLIYLTRVTLALLRFDPKLKRRRTDKTGVPSDVRSYVVLILLACYYSPTPSSRSQGRSVAAIVPFRLPAENKETNKWATRQDPTGPPSRSRLSSGSSIPRRDRPTRIASGSSTGSAIMPRVVAVGRAM